MKRTSAWNEEGFDETPPCGRGNIPHLAARTDLVIPCPVGCNDTGTLLPGLNPVMLAGPPELAELWDIDALARAGRVRWLICYGHSRCVVAGCEANPGPAGGMEKVTASVRASAARLARIKESVAAEVVRLRASPALCDVLDRGEMHLVGLVRLDESGLFLFYDEKGRQFRPLEDFRGG